MQFTSPSSFLPSHRLNLISSSNKEEDRPLPDQTSAVAPQTPFTFSVVPPHKMALANSAIKMACLNTNLEAIRGDTHVEPL